MAADSISVAVPIAPSAPGGIPAAPTSIPWIGIVAVLVGAVASTLTTRLTSQGLADIRGAIGAGFDEGSWITTTFGIAQMVIGPVAVWLGRSFGLRNVLLTGCVLYGISELLIPVAPNLSGVLALQALAGMGSGTFIPLTISFILLNLPPRLRPYGIAAYALNIVLALNVAATIEGFYSEYSSWHWIFWQNAIVSVPLFALFWFGLPRGKLDLVFHRNINYWAMFCLSVGLGLLYAALDQGDRLDWDQSGFIVGLFSASLVFLGLFLVSESRTEKLGIDFTQLTHRNLLLLALLIVIIRFLVSSTNIIVPNFLTLVRGLRPLQVGDALVWVALPQILIAPLAAWLLLRIDARPLMIIGMLIVAVACVMGARLTSTWSESSFVPLLLVQAVGQTLALTALVYFFALHITPATALTFGLIIQTTRLLGGEIGTAALTVFTRKVEQTVSNLLGLHVGIGNSTTLDRLGTYSAALGAHSQGTGHANSQVLALLASTVRNQAYTIAYADGFWLAAIVAGVGVLAALALHRAPPPPAI